MGEVDRELPKLLIANKARTFIEGLPLLDAKKLGDHRERKRAMAILSFLGDAYVWGEKETTRAIPASLAVPWYQVACMLGRPPCFPTRLTRWTTGEGSIRRVPSSSAISCCCEFFGRPGRGVVCLNSRGDRSPSRSCAGRDGHCATGRGCR